MPLAKADRIALPAPSRATGVSPVATVDVFETLDSAVADFSWLASEGAATGFQSFEWLKIWFDTIGHLRRVESRTLVVRNANGQPVLILPLCIEEAGTFRTVRCAGFDVSDYHAPVALGNLELSRGDLLELRNALLARLRDCDVLEFERMPAFVGPYENPLLKIFRPALLSYSSWFLPLPSLRADFDRKQLDPSFVKELKRKGRRLRGRGDMRFLEARSIEDRKRVFEALCTQRERRFAELGRSNILADEAYRKFYERVLLQSDVCRLFAIEVDGQVVSTALGPFQKGQLHVIFSTIAGEEWKSSSPGNVLFDEMISLLIEEGSTHLDFTIGDEAYKRTFGSVSQPLYATTAALSLRGVPRMLLHEARRVGRDATRRCRSRLQLPRLRKA